MLDARMEMSYTFVIQKEQDLEPEIHPHALKHLSRAQVLQAWASVGKSIKRASNDEPPRWLCLGWLSNGESVELVAVETTLGWLIIHALSPAQPKFLKELEMTERHLL